MSVSTISASSHRTCTGDRSWSAPSIGGPGTSGRGFDKSDGSDRRRAGTRPSRTGLFGTVEGVAVGEGWDKDECVKYATDAGRGPVRLSALRLLLLLRCRNERGGEGGVVGARRGDEVCLGGGVGGWVVHVGFGGEG